MKVQAEVLRVVTPSSVVAGYRHFGGPCFLHINSETNELEGKTTFN